MTAQHDRVIASAAHSALAPLGMIRKGKSRVWLDDQRWWLGVVTFKPANQVRGTYLDAGMAFLWHPPHRGTYDVFAQVAGFTAAESDDFAQQVHEEAELAAQEVLNLRSSFDTFDAVVRWYAPVSGRTNLSGQGNLGVALGLVGNMEHCRRALDRAVAQRQNAGKSLQEPSRWVVEAREAASDAATFRAWVQAGVMDTRRSLGLPGRAELPAGDASLG